MKNLFPESLAGRKVLDELYPLEFQEYIWFKEKKKDFIKDFDKKDKAKSKISYELYKNHFEDYINFGGFPAVVLKKGKERKREILEDIFKSYFEKDVKTLTNFKNLSGLRDMILLLASRVGSKLDISKLSSELGLARETVYSYLNFLEKTYFLFLLSPFSKSVNGEVRGARKIYFCDTGLLNFLGKVSEGVLFENAVFLNLRKYGSLNYYQKYKGPEIDFILNKKIAFEAKIKAIPSDFKRLVRISKDLGLKKYFLVVKEFSDTNKTILVQDL